MPSNGTNGVDGPLKGIRVLDWTMWQFGPVSAAMMGDMGADVIKIEPLDGDAGRALRRATTLRVSLPGGRNAYFETCNRNKRGFAVNLKTPEGKEIFHKLVETADVLVENFRKGVAERLGVGYETLHEINPRLVYGSASGYGPEGPDAYLPSFDGCGQARAGLMMAATPLGAKEPTRVIHGVSDQIGAIMLCQGVLAALVSRGIRGTGQKVDASHLSSNMWLQGMGLGMSLMTGGEAVGPYDRKRPVNPMASMFECKDGRWVQLMHLQPDRHWEPFATVLGIPELIDDPRFATMEARAENAELVQIMDKIFLTRTYDEWDRAFREGGDFIYAKVQGIHELPEDSQVVANNYISTFDHPVLGPIKVCNHPNIYSDTPAGVWREAPELGQHTEEILIDELGYTWDDITAFQEAGAIL